ncbi:MAG: 2-amino-4-hydroxy-6-hydroxymethyldihydropteridine diphosphokinase [Lentisphaerae bacterium]|nr:2-amino-4-hydroxy-6-hydroxymethyldihydropteridine diphosphokinase [Lentisphaerota bacterium]
MKIEAGLSLGSNLGDRLAALRAARSAVAGLDETELIACSPVYETAPVGVPDEFGGLTFLNAVVIVRTALSPADLFRRIRDIESAQGRARAAAGAPRTIDLDLIFAGGAEINTPELVLPHPRWSSRRFVVQPLADVMPDTRLPGANRTVSEVLASLPASPAVSMLADSW